MAEQGIQINVGADVKGALRGIEDLKNSLQTVSKVSGTIAVGGITAIGFAALNAFGVVDNLKELLNKLGEEFTKSLNSQKQFTDAISAATPAVTKNIGSVVQLVNALENGNLTYKETAAAQKALVTIAPTFKDAFDKNGKAVKDLSDVLYDDYIPAIVNTIRLNAATSIINAKLQKSFETIANQGTLTGLEKLQNALVDAFGPIAGTKTSQFGKLNQSLSRLSPETVAAEIKQVYENLGISIEDFGKRIVKGAKTAESLKKITDLLKEYRIELQTIATTETAFGQNLSLDKLTLTFKTYEDLIKKGLQPTSKELVFINSEINKFIDALPKIQKVTADIKNNLDPARGLQFPDGKEKNPISTARADRTSSIVITPEALQRAGQYGSALDGILERQARLNELAKTLSDTFTNGINAGIDTFFNAIANNQDPFEALAQSAKRLVVELAAAVVKALALKAITAALSGGTSAGAGLLSGLVGGGGGGGVLRGDQLRLLMGR